VPPRRDRVHGAQQVRNHAHRHLQHGHLALLHPRVLLPVRLHGARVGAGHGEAVPGEEAALLRLLHLGAQRGARHRQPRQIDPRAGLSVRAHRLLRRVRCLHRQHP